MANKDLLKYAHTFRENDDVTWFEMREGIVILIDWVVNREEFLIPWQTVREALKRKDKK